MGLSLFRLCNALARRLIVGVTLALTALVIATPAHAEWREASSPHFIIYSNGSERELIRYSERLEAVHWLLAQATGADTSTVGPKVRIYLVPSISDVRQAMGARPNSNVAGYYTTDPGGAYAVVPRDGGAFAQQILFHEYAHHFMFQYMRHNFPPWVVEGFAEVASTSGFERPGTITWGKVNQERQYEIEQAPWTPMEALLSPRERGNNRRGIASYGQYWIVAHYLMFSPSRRGQLNAYLNAVNRGATLDEANALFVGGIQQLDREARAYQRTRIFEYRQPALPPDIMQPPTVRVMRPGEGEALSFGPRIDRALADDERARVLAQLTALQTRYPAEPTIPLIIAQVHYRAEAWAAAQVAARQVQALEPGHAEAQAYLTLAMMHEREAAGTLSDDDARLTRGDLMRAARAAPTNPFVQAALFDSFRIAGQTPPAIAIDRLAIAVRLLPQREDLRMELSMQLLRVRQFPLARAALTGLAYDPHGGEMAGYARSLITWIDDGASGAPPIHVSVTDVAPAGSN